MRTKRTRAAFRALVAAPTLALLLAACGGEEKGESKTGEDKRLGILGSSAAVAESMRGAEASSGRNDSEAAKAVRDGIEARWKKFEGSIRSNDLGAIAAATGEFDWRDAEVQVARRRDAEIAPGQTLGAWFDGFKDRAARTFRKIVALQMDELGEGRGSPQAVRDFASGLPAYLGDPRQAYEKLKERAAASRARHAFRWLRASVDQGDAETAELLKNALREKWDPAAAGGRELSFEWPLDEAEKRSTWGELRVSVKIKNTDYATSSSKPGLASMVQLPSSVTATFEAKLPPGTESSWSRPISVLAAVEPPSSMLLNSDEFWEEVGEKADEFRGKLREALAKKLETELPAFEFFPGVAREKLTAIGDEGAFDLGGARAALLVDPERLAKELETFLDASDRQTLGGVAAMMIEAGLERHADWIEKALASAERGPGLDAAADALERQPWFADYGPVLFLLREIGHPKRNDAMNALRGHLHERRPFEALMAMAANPDDPRRSDAATLLAREAPEERLEELGVWVEDKDPDFARRAFNALKNRDEALAARLMADNFEGAHPDLQAQMLSGFRFDPEKHGENEVKMLAAAAASENRQLAENARNALLKSAGNALVWDALRERVLPKLSDERTKAEALSRLIVEARRARPDFALEYLRGQIEEQDKAVGELLAARAASGEKPRRGRDEPPIWLRDSAINSYLIIDGPRSERVSLLAGLVRARPEDDRLLRAAMMNVNQFIRRESWDYAQDDLAFLVGQGAADPDANVRRFAYNIMAQAYEQGEDSYKERLEEALETEEDKTLAKQSRQLLDRAKAKRGKKK